MTLLRFTAACLLAASLSACEGSGREQPTDAPKATTASANSSAAPVYKVGEARVHALIDGRGPFPTNLFQGLSADETLTLLRAGDEATTDAEGKPAWAGSVWAFLVDIGGRRVLVDTGAGAPYPGLDSSRTA